MGYFLRNAALWSSVSPQVAGKQSHLALEARQGPEPTQGCWRMLSQPRDGSLADRPTFEWPICLGKRMAADLLGIGSALGPHSTTSTRMESQLPLARLGFTIRYHLPMTVGEPSVSQTSFQVLLLPSRDAILVSYLLTQFPLAGPHTVGQNPRIH